MRRLTAGLMALLVFCAALNTGNSEAGWRRRARRECCPQSVPTSNVTCAGSQIQPDLQQSRSIPTDATFPIFCKTMLMYTHGSTGGTTYYFYAGNCAQTAGVCFT